MRALALLLLSTILAVTTAQTTVNVIPGNVTDSTSAVQFSSPGFGFDGVKVLPLNSSTFEWWYFDAISPDLDYSLVLVFYAAASTGLDPEVPPTTSSATYASFTLTLPDGTSVDGSAFGEDLRVVTVGNGSSGTLGSTGWSWSGLPDMSEYAVTVASPKSGLEGSISLQSVSRSVL